MTRGGHVFTPVKTANAETLIQFYAAEAMGDGTPMEGPVGVTIAAKLPIPQSWSLKRRELAADGFLLPNKRPDIDNLAKTITDAMNGIVYADDKQVVHLEVFKEFGPPSTYVRVTLIDPTGMSELFDQIRHELEDDKRLAS